MKLNEIKTQLIENQIFTNETWPLDHYIKKINENNYGIFNKKNNLIETIFDLNLLPEEGWNIFEDKLIKDLKDMKIGRICQSYN
jgi:hypothetical protein